MSKWQSVPCPKCQRKGLHYASHPHAFGWKDRSRIEYRFCHARFTVKPVAEQAMNKEG